MAGFEYGNARLRAMRSRLISRREMETLAECRSLTELISQLSLTSYRRAVQAALMRATDLESIYEAVYQELTTAITSMRSYYEGSAADQVSLILRAYDVFNLKTVLRGLQRRAPPAEISASLLPVGELSQSVLSELARSSGPRAAVDILASLGIPLARPLMALRADKPGAEIFEMELALERWRYEDARQRWGLGATGVLPSAMKLEADLANLMVALRFAHAPDERRLVSIREGVPDLESLFVPGGRLERKLLVEVAQQTSVRAAADLLAGTVYGKPLSEALETYEASRRLSEVERKLKRYQFHWMVGLISRDPLGAGVPLGFLALKTVEANNIRWIARGLYLRLPAGSIHAGLELLQ